MELGKYVCEKDKRQSGEMEVIRWKRKRGVWMLMSTKHERKEEEMAREISEDEEGGDEKIISG